MLGVNQLDFINYCNALKGNYRKGVHKMETLLEIPTHAKEFAKNLGGVSVVLGTPVGKEDRNSETLRSMLLASDVANDAVYTWMGQYYEFDSWDELLGDEDRCKAMMANELLWRALSASGVAMGKTVATLAGLSCSAYDDMSAVAASSTAMAAIIANSTAFNAVVSSSAAMSAVAASQTAMTAVAASSTAMAAIFRSSTVLQVVQNNASAWAIFSNASSAVMGKTVAELAGLNPSGYADMNAIASSSTAMTAVINSEAARTALVSSSVARKALKASSLAVEMSLVSSDGQYWNSIGTKTMRGLILYTKAGNTDNAFTITKVDSTTLASNNNARNAATSGSTGYKDWLEAFPNSSWVLSSITFYAYYRTTKIKYIPC